MKNKQLFQQLKLELNRKLDELEDQMNQNKLSITDLEVNMLELVFKTQDQDNPYLKSLDSETSAMYGELQTEYYVTIMTTQEKDKWLRLSQRYRKLGVIAVNGAFAELENNLWEEGWSGNPLSYRQTDHGIYIEVMLRSIGEISLKYKNYDDFWNKVKDEEGAYKVAQPIYNKWSELLYPQIQLVNGLNQTKIPEQVLRK